MVRGTQPPLGKTMKKLLFFFLAFFTFHAAHAVLQYRYVHNMGPGGQSGWSTTRGATCNALPPYDDPGGYNSCNRPDLSGSRVSTWEWDAGAGVCKRRLTLGAVCTFISNSGEATEETRQAPENEVCEVGKQQVVNITAGYSRGLSQDATYPDFLPNGQPAPPGYTGLPPEQMCVGGCQMARGDVVASWRSTVPTSSGMYRTSDDWNMTVVSGSACTPSANDQALTSGTANPPPCDGTIGEVNGKIVCAPPANTNLVPSIKPGPYQTGNPTAGSTGGVSSIPVTGNGGNQGGPATPTDGTLKLPDGTTVYATGTTSTPSGTRTSTPGEEQLACGAPGQPKCRIDESGTPSNAGSIFAGANTNIDTQKSGLEAIIAGANTKQLPSWSWSFQLPTSCAPIELEAFSDFLPSIDLCQFQPVIHDLMSLLWIACTIWSCISMVGRVLGA